MNVWGPQTDFGLSSEEMLDEVGLHLERHIGEHQVAFSDADGWSGASKEHGPPVDVLVVPPSGERRFVYVASFGCAFRPLPAQAYAEKGVHKRVEFVLAAPQRGEQQVDRAMLNLAANTVRQFAKLAHLQPITVEIGQTVAFAGEEAPVFPGSEQTAFAFIAPRLPSDGFEELRLSNGVAIRYVAPVPIYPEELAMAHAEGPEALADALMRGGVTEMLDLDRVRVVQPPPPPKRSWFSRLLWLVGIR